MPLVLAGLTTASISNARGLPSSTSNEGLNSLIEAIVLLLWSAINC